MPFLMIYITHPTKEAAETLCHHLINQRLIACANIFPIDSVYLWRGAITQEGEYVSIVKTRTDLWDELQTAIRKAHSYEVPCIMKITVEANRDYELWIAAETEVP